MLKGCDRKTLVSVRDYAMIRVFYDSGLRLQELLSMQVDAKGEYELITVIGKGNKQRTVRIGAKSQIALLQYVRRWKLQRGPLWVGQRGPLERTGVYNAIREAGERAGLRVWPHLLRHSFGTSMADNEAPEEAIMELMGHSSSSMTRLYTASRRQKRAIKAHEQYGPGDRV